MTSSEILIAILATLAILIALYAFAKEIHRMLFGRKDSSYSLNYLREYIPELTWDEANVCGKGTCEHGALGRTDYIVAHQSLSLWDRWPRFPELLVALPHVSIRTFRVQKKTTTHRFLERFFTSVFEKTGNPHFDDRYVVRLDKKEDIAPLLQNSELLEIVNQLSVQKFHEVGVYSGSIQAIRHWFLGAPAVTKRELDHIAILLKQFSETLRRS
jgi:hypothetical protein